MRKELRGADYLDHIQEAIARIHRISSSVIFWPPIVDHIQEAIARIHRHTRGKGEAEFMNSELIGHHLLLSSTSGWRQRIQPRKMANPASGRRL